MFFENNFREFGTLNAVCEEIMKLHIFIESRRSIFKKELIFSAECTIGMVRGLTPLKHYGAMAMWHYGTMAIRCKL